MVEGVQLLSKASKALEDVVGRENLPKLLSALSRPPPTTVRVNTLVVSREKLVEDLREYLPPLLKDGIVPHKILPDVIVIKTLGPTERSPEGLPRVCVSQKCGEAVLRGANIFAPGVLAAEPTAKLGARVAVFADLTNKTLKGSYQISDPKAAFYLGNGIVHMDREMLFHTQKPTGVAMVLEEAVYLAPSLNAVMQDKIYLQNLPSAVVSHALDPQPGEYVLDMCASPGGKTTHLGILMKNQGQIIAFDRGYEKVKDIERNVDRLGIKIVKVYRNDATKYSRYIVDSEEEESRDEKKPAFLRESFDRILVDPPCSALGIRPRLTLPEDITADLHSKALFQRQFLRAAAMLLKPGGILAYSTCTINPKENEENVRFALNQFPLELLAPKVQLGEPGAPGCGLTDEQRSKVQRFNPWGPDDTPGFFCALFRKTESYK